MSGFLSPSGAGREMTRDMSGVRVQELSAKHCSRKTTTRTAAAGPGEKMPAGAGKDEAEMCSSSDGGRWPTPAVCETAT